MCLIFFSLQHHPNYKLILAGNRDEFYNRQTGSADFWKDNPQILGGRDLEANGTWLAMTKSGRIGFITNYRDPKNIKVSAPSRGKLVSDYLESNLSPQAYLEQIEKRATDYNGFNLIVGNADAFWYLSNYQRGIQQILPGFYGLSNHVLETPWPKIVYGKERLKPILMQAEIHPDQLMDRLYDSTQALEDKLPDTGLGLAREQALSSMFIKTPGYGSRCSTVLLIDRNNNVVFTERTYDLATFNYSTKAFQFTIN